MGFVKLTIFYSWQTETETTYNKNFIYTCIDKAVKKLGRKPEFKEVDFIIQEGVKGEPGSPGIASKIADDRIPNCDIFIADLSVVNQIGWFEKAVKKVVFRNQFRPSQNNNVVIEYGVAFNAVGVGKIIGVLNKAYGSPNKNPNNITFDLRHLRFPVEYEFSSKTKNKEAVQKQLVDGLVTAIRDTAIYALQHQRTKYNPLMVWQDWEKSLSTKESFVHNAKVDEIEKLIKQSLSDSKLTVRILGLSGLGKTRMLLEIFRPLDANHDSILLSSRVLYINCSNNPNADYQAIFIKLNSDREARIVVLDNCSVDIHRQALAFARQENNRTFFISLDSNPEEIKHNKINGANYLLINKDDLSIVVDEILKRDFAGIGDENVRIIKEFSQGIPLMAVLLAESIKDGEKFIGKLEDKSLLDKLLGPKGRDARNRAILKASSIFNFFGYSGDLTSQVEFIAKSKHITSLNGDDTVIVNEFHEVCQYYLTREIFEQKGRFIGMRPFPLAMSLAQEWLEPCTPQRLLDVITSIAQLEMPDRHDLSEALSERMKYLGYNDKAIQIVESIIGPSSPFDNAEVLNTDLGSRLFRSFVEVNPVAVSQNLKRVFSNKTEDELLNIKAGRRNLIWVLEKLCFDRRTFNDSVKLMYSFAVAENETWSNNATGQLLQLFNVGLPGTESTLDERLKIIEWGLQQDNSKFRELAIKAIKVGLSFGHFHRAGGAEQQGSKTLLDFQPSFADTGRYWSALLSILWQQIALSNEFADESLSIITSSARGICRARHDELIIPLLGKIAQYKNYDWDNGLNTLKAIRKFDLQHLLEHNQEYLNELIEKLTKVDFLSRYKNAVTHFQYNSLGEFYSTEKMIELVSQLADEFIDSNIDWDKTLPLFYKKDQTYSFHFGKRIHERLKGDSPRLYQFVDSSLLVIKLIAQSERDVSVLAGFLSEGIQDLRKYTYDNIFAEADLTYLLFYLIASSKPEILDFERLFSLIDSGRNNLNELLIFANYFAFWNLEIDKTTWLFKKLNQYGKDGCLIFFKMAEHAFTQVIEQRINLKSFFKHCYHEIGIIREFSGTMDEYGWFESLILILKEEDEIEFARFVNQSFIDRLTFKNSLFLDTDAQRLYEILLTKYFDAIWYDLSSALLSKNDKYEKFYCLKGILGSHIGGVGRNVGVLFDGNLDEIFEWCKENSPIAVERLAELVPIFSQSNNALIPEWHPIAKRLIDEFGSIPEGLSGLNINMGSYSWTGSSVPLLESKKQLFEQLTDHKFSSVSDWASRNILYMEDEIKNEKIRDEEMFL